MVKLRIEQNGPVLPFFYDDRKLAHGLGAFKVYAHFGVQLEGKEVEVVGAYQPVPAVNKHALGVVHLGLEIKTDPQERQLVHKKPPDGIPDQVVGDFRHDNFHFDAPEHRLVERPHEPALRHKVRRNQDNMLLRARERFFVDFLELVF